MGTDQSHARDNDHSLSDLSMIKSRQVAGFFSGADQVSSGIFMLWFPVQLLGFMELG